MYFPLHEMLLTLQSCLYTSVVVIVGLKGGTKSRSVELWNLNCPILLTTAGVD